MHKIEIKDKNKKYAPDSAIQLPIKSNHRPLVLQRPSAKIYFMFEDEKS